MKTTTCNAINKPRTQANNAVIGLVFSTLFLLFPVQIKAQTLTTPQVPFLQRTSMATPSQTIYNVKGDFTMLGNTNLTLLNYVTTTNNEGNTMKYVDVDDDSNTLNASKATLELSNSGENGANQNCSTVLFAGLYWTGKSDDAYETFSVSDIMAVQNFAIPNTNYVLTVSRAGSSNNYYPVYTFTGNGHIYAFSFNNVLASGTTAVTLTLDAVAQPAIDVAYNSGTATLTAAYTSNPAFGAPFTMTRLTRNTSKSYTLAQYQSTSYANVLYSPSKNYDKKEISLKGPGATTYTNIVGISEIRFPGASNSGIFIGYQEVTDYVKTHGPGAYTVADIALKEGINGSSAQNPGYSGGWAMVVIYENPVMKSRAVTLFDGYAYVNGQLSGGGEYATIPISGFTTVDAGPVNMKLGVMAAEGDVALTGDYLAVQKLNADPAVYPANYLILNHAGNTTNNFFNSSIFPFPAVGNSNLNLVNNTGVDFSMFTIPNAANAVIANNQTATTFRFGSTSDVFTIFGFAMSVDAYVPKPEGIIGVNSIDGVLNPPILSALPGQIIEYALNITNNGTEPTINTVVSIPMPITSIFKTGSISYTKNAPLATTNVPYFDAINNEIKWDIGNLPIVAGDPDFLLGTLTFQLIITEDCAILINAGCAPEISLSAGNITGEGTISGVDFIEYFFQGYDSTFGCDVPIEGSIVVTIDNSGTACYTQMAGPNQTASCGLESVLLEATTGTEGVWSGGGSGTFSPSNTDPNAIFTAENGVYTLRWTSYFCAAIYDEVEITLGFCDKLNFDGVNDNINFGNNYSLNTGYFSLETWIKSNASTPLNGTVQSIISKRTAPNSTDGYDLRLVNNYISFNWNNGNSITSLYPIDQNRWYYVAVTFNGSEYNLYIDGILVKAAVPGSNPVLNNNVNCIVGTMDQNQNFPQLQNCFNGWMDELRIWNIDLSVNQIREMMNQEIEDNCGNVKGTIVPQNISGLTWDKLAGYYQMNAATDIENGFILDKATATANGKLRNIYSLQAETAPLPYTTKNDGDWTNKTPSTPWMYGNTVWDFPNSLGIDNVTPIDWNIVQTSHNITSGDKNITVLGLISTAGKLTIADPSENQDENNSGQSIRITHYLELDGAFDLVGESQLLQDEGSILDQDSGGYIERDQQGTANSYNYNYWASSVNPITASGVGQRGAGTASNNANYAISGILKDGTNAAVPGSITFLPAYYAADAGVTSPIIISSYWLYKFNGPNDDYNSWFPRISELSLIKAGEGYTMKGTSGGVNIANQQNYVFKGKPNNGDITLEITKGNDRLIGNPYASAMDADEFIKDNIKETINSKVGRNTNNVFNGALYFWDHFGQINTHILREYVGGYATYNLMGGAKAISNDYRINANLAEGSKIPTQYIAVGQGFFVVTSLDPLLVGTTTAVDGGNIIFKNSQRIFKTEAAGNSVFMKGVNAKKVKAQNETNAIADKRAKIWLQFNSPTGYHRQLLVGVDENASNHFDLGYDAPIADIGKEDMYWMVDGGKFVIQGVDNFDKKQVLPLGLKIFKAGIASIKIDASANLGKNIQVYLKDMLTGKAHKLDKSPFEMYLEPGTYLNRFSVVFNPGNIKSGKPGVDENENDKQTLTESFLVYMNNTTSELQITKPVDAEIVTVNVYNYLGQSTHTWSTNLNESIIYLPLKVSSGAYIVQINTKTGPVVHKVIVE